MHTNRWVASVSLFLLALNARADVRLNALFSDNMVLQQGMEDPIWGWADDGEEITISINGKTVKTTGKGGKFKAKLPKLKASAEPATLTVKGKNEITLKNVLVGEVWVASGQSNMEFPLSRSYQSASDIQNSANPNIRLFTVQKDKELKPVENVKVDAGRGMGTWVVCNPQTVPPFSAVAYYFGRDLQKALNVPVGLIHTSWGGSPAEVWMSEEVLRENPEYKRDILDIYSTQEENYKKALETWEKDRAAAQKDGKAFNRARPNAPWRPTELYNGMIAPLIPYAIKGAIWYQGESNAGRHKQYRTLYPDMISNWRKDWGQGEFAFIGVQLAPFFPNHTMEQLQAAAPAESNWAALREAQVYATETLPKVGIAVITDVGEINDIHPTKKEPVGARLALQAEKIAYGKNVVASGPTFKSMSVKGNEAVLSFDNMGGGLEPKDAELTGFAIAGEDGKFVWGKAHVEGKKVVVSSPEVAKPVAVRFGWAEYPLVNLKNKEGLPASPFRTDSPKKEKK
jgi:sialate O-acetylesterase